MTHCLIGVDVGTSVIKATLFGTDGAELQVSTARVALLRPVDGWVELDMQAVWRAVVETLGRTARFAHSNGHTVAAVGITGQGDGTWLVDGEGAPVRNAITWLDGRVADAVTTAHTSGLSESVFAITGTALNTANQALHLRWLLDHEPQSLERAAAALRAKDWIFLCLTGICSTDESDASHTWFDVAQRSPAPQLPQMLGIESLAHLLPAALPAHENRASLLPAVATLVDLPTGTPVVAGPFDVVACDLGVGVVSPGDGCTILGTAGIHQMVIAQPVAAPRNIGYTCAHAPTDRLIRLLPTMTGTLNLEWFVREFFDHESAQVQSRGGDFWAEAEALAQQVSPGCDGVIYHPYIDAAGERAPFVRPNARAQFTGLSAEHSRALLLRAVYEGVVLSALDCYQVLDAPLQRIKLTGGGSRSRFWAQMFADALGCPVQTVAGTESGACGAAITAGIAVGIFSSYEEGVAAMVRSGVEYLPNAQNTALYRELLGLYRSSCAAMFSVWEERALWRRRHPQAI